MAKMQAMASLRRGELDAQNQGERRQNDGVYKVEEAIKEIGFGIFQVLLFLLCGSCWFFLAVNISFFVLPSAVQSYNECGWNITCSEEALITTVLIVGALVANLWWGPLMDHLGRKLTINILMWTLACSGLLSAIPVSEAKEVAFIWLLCCRFGVGAAYGGIQQISAYLSEFFSKKTRGVFVPLLEMFMASGSITTAFVAMVVLNHFSLGWRWYLCIASIPAIIFLPLYFFLLPESPRYLIAKGEEEKALKVLKFIAKLNCKEIQIQKLIIAEQKEEPHPISAVNPSLNEVEVGVADPSVPEKSGAKALEERRLHWTEHVKETIKLLLCDGMWKTILLTTALWYIIDALFIGINLLTPVLLQSKPQCGDSVNITECSCQENVNCTTLENDDYLKIAWTLTAEFPGVIIVSIINGFIGRKLTMATTLASTMAGLLLLFICVSEVVTTLFLFLIRGFLLGAYMAVYTYSAEVYPTRVRGVAQSIGGFAARIGGAVTPFIAQVLFCESHYLAIGTYAGLALAAAIAALLLPIETKGKATKD